jgi:protein disulfide-isomerase
MKRNVLICALVLAVAAIGSADVFEWSTDLDAALETAAEEEKAVFVYFAGTDWCGWCHRLMDEVLHTTAFEEYADEALVPVLVDFPRDRTQSEELQQRNMELAREYEIAGFPTVYVLSPEEEVILKTGYLQGGPANYIDQLRSAVTAFEG